MVHVEKRLGIWPDGAPNLLAASENRNAGHSPEPNMRLIGSKHRVATIGVTKRENGDRRAVRTGSPKRSI